MSFNAILHLGDGDVLYDSPNNIKILDCEYGFSQQIDKSSRPIERPSGGLISLVVESSKKEEFVDWMLDSEMVKNGTIVFMGREGTGQCGP